MKPRDGEIRYYYYPILSGTRPDDGGSGQIGEFSVLVRSNTKKRITGPDRPIDGSMAVGILSLSSELRDDLQELFPQIDARKVILFIEGGRQKGTMRYWVVGAFGGLILLVGMWLVVEKRD